MVGKKSIVLKIFFVVALIVCIIIALEVYSSNRVYEENLSVNNNLDNKVKNENSSNIHENISNQNNSREDNKFKSPSLSIDINKLEENKYWMDVNVDSDYGIGEMSGYELYKSTEKDGEYKLINTRYYGVANAGFGEMEDPNTMFYYKVREFKENEINNKEYTGFSNIVGPVNKNYK